MQPASAEYALPSFRSGGFIYDGTDDLVVETVGIPERKQIAARYAADLVQNDMTIGLGTGSTASLVLARLAERTKEGLRFTGVATSFQTEILARRLGIALVPLGEEEDLDLAIDGADQVDPAGCLLKGRGGAHVREKCVADAARRFVVVVTPEKLVDRLSLPVPVEVLPFAWMHVSRAVSRIGGLARIREGGGKDGPLVTDNGNFVLDCDFGEIADPSRLEYTLDTIPGAIGNGIFSRFRGKTMVVVGEEGGPRLLSF